MSVLFLGIYMLQKKYRLKKYSAIIATYRIKNIVADSNVCIYLGKEKNNIDMTTKFAFVVSKKIHKRAVIRNRIKRLMRESVRLLLKESQIENINKYLSVIIVAKHNAIGLDYKAINSSINKILMNIQ